MAARPDQDLVMHPLEVARHASIAGVATAIPGTMFGAYRAKRLSPFPVLFTIASGLQCFGIGFTYWGARTVLLNKDGLTNWWNRTRGVPLRPRTDLTPSESDRMRASCFSGAFTGVSLGLLYRGPKNVIPGTIMFTLYGFVGQYTYNYLDRWNSDEIRNEVENKRQEQARKEESKPEEKAEPGWFRKMIEKSQILKKITPEEYQEMMTEKLIGVEADIAIIEEKIEDLRQKQRKLDEEAEAEHKARIQAKENAQGQEKN